MAFSHSDIDHFCVNVSAAVQTSAALQGIHLSSLLRFPFGKCHGKAPGGIIQGLLDSYCSINGNESVCGNENRTINHNMISVSVIVTKTVISPFSKASKTVFFPPLYKR